MVLEPGLARVNSPEGERGLPLIWRAGPRGGPAGGEEVSEIGYAPDGRHGRPWAPAHLRAEARADGGLDLSWIARTRVGGDRWDGEPAASDPLRFRVRAMADGVQVRAWEVEGTAAVYAASDLAADGADQIGVAQWGEGYGWGDEAVLRL